MLNQSCNKWIHIFTGERDLQTLLPEVTDSTDFLALHEPISGNQSVCAIYFQAICV